MVHFKSKAFERTILKICGSQHKYPGIRRAWTRTFCTLMLWLVLEKMRDARMAFAKRLAYDFVSYTVNRLHM